MLRAMSERQRRGIMGTGNTPRQFADGVTSTARRSHVVAVGSRSADSAKTFAAKHELARAHGSYDELLADPDVQAIYLSLPDALHHEWTVKSLKAGKHVLCEKPFALTRSQGAE